MPVSSQHSSSGQLFGVVRDAFNLLDRRERHQVVLLVLGLAFTGLVDMVALASIMPVITVIVEPNLIERYEVLTWVRGFLPGLTANQFVIGTASGAAFFLTLSTGLNLVMLWANNRFGAAIQTRLARDIMLSAMRAPYSWHLTQNSAALVRFFHSDIIRWGRDFVQRLISMAQHLVSMVVPLALVLVMAPVAGLFSLLIIAAIAFLLTRMIQPRIRQASGTSKQATDRLVVVANNALAGVKDIKLACREEQFAHEFSNVFRYANRAAASLGTWQAIPSSILMLFGQLALLAVGIALWARGLSHGAIAGQMALVVLVASRVVPAVNRFFGLFSSMWDILPWVGEVIRVERELTKLNAQAQPSNAPAAPQDWAVLALADVAFTYSGKEQAAVGGISLEIRRGRSYGFVGMSGAGKSTLVDIIIGLYKASSGDIRLDGASLYGLDMKTWQSQIGYVPQFPYIADDTLKANVALGISRREIDDARVSQCLELANLSEFVDTLPQGMNTPVGDRGIRMSGGQRQRLAIARAFYQNPQLLVLDEATSSLDTVSEKEVQQAVAHLHGKVTMLIIAHRLPTVRECDEILLLNNGRLVARGSYDELLASSPLFRDLAALQDDGGSTPAGGS